MSQVADIVTAESAAQQGVLNRNGFDVQRIREDFPILKHWVNGKPLVYLDSAATSQKPQVVIDAMNHYYLEENSNIHRGVHYLSDKATQSYEAARVKVQKRINASSAKEIIFTRGTTESINLVAASYGRTRVEKGDVVLISALEHHSNIVPWQILAAERGVSIQFVPITADFLFDMEAYRAVLALLCSLRAPTRKQCVTRTKAGRKPLLRGIWTRRCRSTRMTRLFCRRIKQRLRARTKFEICGKTSSTACRRLVGRRLV